jgi:hypothetical protein
VSLLNIDGNVDNSAEVENDDDKKKDKKKKKKKKKKNDSDNESSSDSSSSDSSENSSSDSDSSDEDEDEDKKKEKKEEDAKKDKAVVKRSKEERIIRSLIEYACRFSKLNFLLFILPAHILKFRKRRGCFSLCCVHLPQRKLMLILRMMKMWDY